jgi:hypothetical protein
MHETYVPAITIHADMVTSPDAVVVAQALHDAKLFVEEFDDWMDPAKTDWDAESWNRAVSTLGLDDEQRDRLWPVYDAALEAATFRMVSWPADVVAWELVVLALARAAAWVYLETGNIQGRHDAREAKGWLEQRWASLDYHEHGLDTSDGELYEDLFVEAGTTAIVWLAEARSGFWHGYWCAAGRARATGEAARYERRDLGDGFRRGWRHGVARGRQDEVRALMMTCCEDTNSPDPRVLISLGEGYRHEESTLPEMLRRDAQILAEVQHHLELLSLAVVPVPTMAELEARAASTPALSIE